MLVFFLTTELIHVHAFFPNLIYFIYTYMYYLFAFFFSFFFKFHVHIQFAFQSLMCYTNYV